MLLIESKNTSILYMTFPTKSLDLFFVRHQVFFSGWLQSLSRYTVPNNVSRSRGSGIRKSQRNKESTGVPYRQYCIVKI